MAGAFKSDLDVRSFDAPGNKQGFRISHPESYWTFFSTGDINGDGVTDVIIGSYGGDLNGWDSGKVIVVFGSKRAGRRHC